MTRSHFVNIFSSISICLIIFYESNLITFYNIWNTIIYKASNGSNYDINKNGFINYLVIILNSIKYFYIETTGV